jgi:pleiotropic regulator 1
VSKIESFTDIYYLTADNGSQTLWDWHSGTPFQTMDDIPQPGSLEAEAGLFCSTFDQTGTRLITGCADKTIKARLDTIFCLFSDY